MKSATSTFDSIRIVSTMPRFSATIYKLGINPVVDPPTDMLEIVFRQAGRSKGPIPVRGKLNGAAFKQTLVKFRGEWRLYVNGPMLKDSRSKVGDTAKIDFEYDPEPRDVAMPGQLSVALRKDKTARSEFEKLSPSRRNEILRYLTSLKTEASVEKNVRRVISHLRGEPTDAQYAMMRRSKDGS